LVEQLSKQVARLKATTVHVQRTDGVACLKQLMPSSVDVVFLDPPFDSPLFEPALQAAAKAVKPEGWVYLEAPAIWSDEALAPFGLKQHRHLKAGAVHAHLLRRVA
jgi:16S rRNA G966 N2-methylase RsmD